MHTQTSLYAQQRIPQAKILHTHERDSTYHVHGYIGINPFAYRKMKPFGAADDITKQPRDIARKRSQRQKRRPCMLQPGIGREGNAPGQSGIYSCIGRNLSVYTIHNYRIIRSCLCSACSASAQYYHSCCPLPAAPLHRIPRTTARTRPPGSCAYPIPISPQSLPIDGRGRPYRRRLGERACPRGPEPPAQSGTDYL